MLPSPLVAQLVKNPPAMQETWVPSLGWADPLETGTATHSSVLACRIPRTVQTTGHKELAMTEQPALSHGGYTLSLRPHENFKGMLLLLLFYR